MNQIEYIQGDATLPIGEGCKIIVHVCNDIGGWGRGFVTALSKRWKEPEQAYRAWYRSGENFELGQLQFVRVETDIWVANLIGQHKIKRSKGDEPPIRYWAIQKGMTELAEKAKELGATIHMPRIGCGLAGGKWTEIEPILEKELLEKDVKVTVYDFD